MGPRTDLTETANHTLILPFSAGPCPARVMDFNPLARDYD
jgi:hypothetical protein